jgi:hypothetical protein
VQPGPAVEGAELVAEYVTPDMVAWPAGVAYTHATMGYQTVNLGFGMECMAGAILPDDYFTSGVSERTDLMANIMEYFGKAPTATPTGAEDGAIFANRLGHPRPNPFNPSTTIAYSLASKSRVTIRVFDCTGRVVRTLVDAEREAGPHATTWRGRTNSGGFAASGVYFVRMEAPGRADSFRATRKLVLLK